MAASTDMQANDRDGVIRAHAGLARNMALRLAGKVPASVDLDDLIGAGVLGLIDAVDRFEAYARTRIQGAILDAMRAEDHLSRRERRASREADRSEDKVRMKLGRELTVEESDCARRGVPRSLAHSQIFVQIDDAGDAALANEETAFARVAAAQEHERVRELVACLPERERTILALYYEEELTYREIGQVMGVTESRICQILRGIHQTLRKGLEESV